MTDGQRFADFARIGVDWLWETDSQDRFTYFSVTNSRTGVELQSRLGLRRRDIAAPAPDNLARIATLEETVARREPFRQFIYHADSNAARPRWYSISGEPRYGTDNEFLGYLGVGRDVTARVEAEKALESQSRALEVILRAIPDGVLLIDKKHATLAVNDRVYEILGIPIRKDRPDGDSAIQLLVALAKRGEYGAGDPEKLARERADGMVRMVAAQQNITYRRQLKTGRWMEARISALDDGGFLWLFRDITEAKEGEAELEQQAALLSTISANMDGGISVFDKDGRLSVWNERFAELIGVDPSLVRHGAPVRDLLVAQARTGEFGPCDPEAEADRRLAIFHTDRPVINERLAERAYRRVAPQSDAGWRLGDDLHRRHCAQAGRAGGARSQCDTGAAHRRADRGVGRKRTVPARRYRQRAGHGLPLQERPRLDDVVRERGLSRPARYRAG